MPKKNHPKLVSIALAAAGWFFTAEVARAQVTGEVLKFLGYGLNDLIQNALATLVTLMLQALGWVLSLAGFLLNISVNFTTHIQFFIDNNSVIYTVWTIIRDISSMFLIFIILYAAIRMVLNLGHEGIGSLLKSIVIMGILINFSFFLARVLIDASNIVSLEFYNAIAPKSANLGNANNIGDMVKASIASGSAGLSDIVMGSLKITSWWDNHGQLGAAASNAAAYSNMSATGRIFLIGVAGSIVIIITIISLLAASAACIYRLVMLIFLLAFSPIWIAGMALPQLSDYGKQWWGEFKSNLFFLPVYLLFMYVALRIVTESGLNTFTTAATSNLSGVNQLGDFIGLFVGFVIVIFIINLPLFAAVSLAGKMPEWTTKMSAGFNKWGKGVLVNRASGLGRGSLGHIAANINQSETFKKVASWSPTAGAAISKGLSGISSASFGGKKGGYDAKVKQQKKDIEAMHKRLGEVDRGDYAPGEVGEKEFKEAQNRARGIQAAYRTSLISSNLSFLSDRNILSRMMISRGASSAAAKLSKDAEKQATKEAKKKALEDKKKLIKEKNELSQISSIIVTGRLGEDMRRNKERRLEEIDKELERLDDAIEKGTAVENEEKDAKIMSKLEEIEKKSGGENGEKKEDKKTT